MPVKGVNAMMWLWYFMIYSMIGWGVEVAYHAVSQGRIVNRGFLNGPVCPVYGFGMLAVLRVFGALEADIPSHGAFVLFFGGILMTTSIELFAGWSLDQLFHARWWDYSKEPFNFRGYICLKFSIIWGLGTVFMYRIVHTTIAMFVQGILPLVTAKVFLLLMYMTFVTDLCVTVMTVRGMNKSLDQIEDLRRRMRIVSDRLSQEIGENTIATAQIIEKQRVQAALGRAEFRDHIEELKQKQQALRVQYEQYRARLYQHPMLGAGRIVRAFPGAVHRKHDELLREFREKLDGKWID